jgi:hypothetical protein
MKSDTLLHLNVKDDGRISQHNSALMIMQTAYNLGMRHNLSSPYTHKHGLTLFIKEDGQLGMM